MKGVKNRAAAISLGVIACLVGVKIAVALVSGSLSVLAQGADSFLDLFSVAVTFISIRIAARPADDEHPFGHGKVESVSAIIQAALIAIAGGLIIYTAVLRLISGATLEMAEAAIGTMAFSMVVSIGLARYLHRVARETESPALTANARNIAADVYSAGAVLVGLLVARITGLAAIDPILAILVALYLFKVAADVAWHSTGELIDERLPEAEESLIHAAITEHADRIVGFHKLRTRKSGGMRHIDLHIVMPRNVGLEEAHDFCDHLEQDVGSKLRQAHLTIHCEPCQDECDRCSVVCEIRRTPG